MRLVGTYRNINFSRQSSPIDLFFFCSTPIFSDKKKDISVCEDLFLLFQSVRPSFSNVDLSVKSIALQVDYYLISAESICACSGLFGIFWFRLAYFYALFGIFCSAGLATLE